MARVTVEDCIERVSNRFDLVMLAAQRAREISAGAPLTIDRDNDKNPVIALREIADETVTPDTLEHSLVQGLQKRADFDEFEDEEDFDAIESEMQLQPAGVVAAVPEPEAESVPEPEAESIEGSEGEAASDPGETDDSLGAEEDK